MIKREFRYIRYRICRSIYYADWCPTDNRKNYSSIAQTIAMGAGMAIIGLGAILVLVTMA